MRTTLVLLALVSCEAPPSATHAPAPDTAALDTADDTGLGPLPTLIRPDREATGTGRTRVPVALPVASLPDPTPPEQEVPPGTPGADAAPSPSVSPAPSDPSVEAPVLTAWPPTLELVVHDGEEGIGLILPAPAHLEQAWVEFCCTEEDAGLSEAEWTELGVPTGGWWVLPDVGAAVPARVASAYVRVVNPCGGTVGLGVRLEAELSEEAVALAALHGDPPASWREVVPAPTLPRHAAEARAAMSMEDCQLGNPRGALRPDGDTWVGRYTQWLRDGEEELTGRYLLQELRVLPDATVVHGDKEVVETAFPTWPVAERDLDGDGIVDPIWADGCHEQVLGPDGSVRYETEFRCCGC